MTARKSLGSEFDADGPACVKERSPNLVHNRGKEKETATWTTAVDGQDTDIYIIGILS